MMGVGKRVIGLMALVLIASAGMVHAAEYRLQVASLDEKVFFRYLESQGAPWRPEQHVLPGLEALLDDLKQAKQVLFTDRKMQPLDPERVAPGQLQPVTVRITLPQRDNSWMTATWEGSPGEIAGFRVTDHQVNWQELTAVAVNTDGVLRRLPVRSIPLFGRKKQWAPATSASYIDHALRRGTFAAWMARHAEERHGLSVIVGRNHDVNYPDTVYLMLRMPPEARTYKVVLAWKNREILEKGNGDNDGSRDN
jgi:hypothetical protein